MLQMKVKQRRRGALGYLPSRFKNKSLKPEDSLSFKLPQDQHVAAVTAFIRQRRPTGQTIDLDDSLSSLHNHVSGASSFMYV